MRHFGEIYRAYSGKEPGQFTDDEKAVMRSELKAVPASELKTREDHLHYIQLVGLFRRSMLKTFELVGDNFLEMIRSMLMVGEDGLYTDKLRFLFELIQNVDDCDDTNLTDCDLRIQFDWNSTPGRIILNYNETGFTPRNVFDITGIAEKSKNIDEAKVEIGEKGIGFKSVFGVADRVWIQSGDFSFEIHSDNFTVPVPIYDKQNDYVSGTRMTLFLDGRKTKDIYRSIVSQYRSNESILRRNPILFLNKLTHLRMFFDDTTRYIDFNVTRNSLTDNNEIQFEDNVVISMDIADHDQSGIDKYYENEINCLRYTKSIVYDRECCVSRYSDKTSFTSKKHAISVIIPRSFQQDNICKAGQLYSFLPTKITMIVPIMLHVPFKLDGSREYVDPQDENKWFKYTIKELSEFIKEVYLDLADRVKQDIVRYLPGIRQYFFVNDNNNDKVNCLRIDALHGSMFENEKLFLTEEGNYQKGSSVIAFSEGINVDRQKEIYHLLGEKKELFIPGIPCKMSIYGTEIIDKIEQRLFNKAMVDSKVADPIFKILSDQNIDIMKFVRDMTSSVYLDGNQIHALMQTADDTISGKIQKYCLDCIKKGVRNKFFVNESVCKINDSDKGMIIEACGNAEFDRSFTDYLRKNKYSIYAIPYERKKNFFFAAANGIVVAEESPKSGFGTLADYFDNSNIFGASLKLIEESEKLDVLTNDDRMDNTEYLNKLRIIRQSVIYALGANNYKKYIQAINMSGADKSRFYNELIQNADDCDYADEPAFYLSSAENQMVVRYNEIGFSKANVRAITSIGESTKKQILKGNSETIGEKGVGFKSIFNVASSVEIHSNGFDFILTDDKPTFPQKCETKLEQPGTTLFLNLKKSVYVELSQDKILQLCLCLRKLRNLEIQGKKIRIIDTKNSRTIDIDGNQHYFEKYVHSFSIEDENLLKERNEGTRIIGSRQKIVIYIAGKDWRGKRHLYVGLPTAVTINVPLIIDAPFHLTTSRDDVLQNKWNETVKLHVYKAIIELMNIKKTEMFMNVFKFTGYRTLLNNQYEFRVFSDDYLNNYSWNEVLRANELIPTLKHDAYVKPNQNCKLVPDVIYILAQNETINGMVFGTPVDHRAENQYGMLLQHLGCTEMAKMEVLKCLNQFNDKYITEKNYRDKVYEYLKSFTFFAGEGTAGIAKRLRIFPVKKRSVTEYVEYSDDLYTHNSMFSQNGIYILDTGILSLDAANNILKGFHNIKEYDQDAIDMRYQKKLISYIESNVDDRQKASYLQREFSNGNIRDSVIYALKGIKHKIPFIMADRRVSKGKRFANRNKLEFSGKFLNSITVSNAMNGFSLKLDFKDIGKITYNDINNNSIPEIRKEDIEDIFQLDNYVDILKALIKDMYISDELIDECELHAFVSDNSGDYIDEVFPGRPVKNYGKLRKMIAAFWKNPNPYVDKQYTKRVPLRPLSKESYVTDMYGSVNNTGTCFCQMCKKLISSRYIERNNILKEPQYAWNQMYLCLCLNCSKDYILFRNNRFLWEDFVKKIMDADVLDQETVDIEISDRTISFTAVHLAEIKEIMKLQTSEGDR